MSFFDDPWGFITGRDQIDKDYDTCVKTCKETKTAAKAAAKAAKENKPEGQQAEGPTDQATGVPNTEGQPAAGNPMSGGRRRRNKRTKKGKKAKKVKSTVKRARK